MADFHLSRLCAQLNEAAFAGTGYAHDCDVYLLQAVKSAFLSDQDGYNAYSS